MEALISDAKAARALMERDLMLCQAVTIKIDAIERLRDIILIASALSSIRFMLAKEDTARYYDAIKSKHAIGMGQCESQVKKTMASILRLEKEYVACVDAVGLKGSNKGQRGGEREREEREFGGGGVQCFALFILTPPPPPPPPSLRCLFCKNCSFCREK